MDIGKVSIASFEPLSSFLGCKPDLLQHFVVEIESVVAAAAAVDECKAVVFAQEAAGFRPSFVVSVVAVGCFVVEMPHVNLMEIYFALVEEVCPVRVVAGDV